MNSSVRSRNDAEEVLIRKASKGNLEAFNQLVLLYQGIAYHSAYAILGDTNSAQDVTQESFIKAFRKVRNFRGGSFRAWLFKIVTNTAYDVLRQSKRYTVQPLFTADEYGEEIESIGWLVDPTAMVEATVEKSEDSRRLYHLLDELPDIFRSVIALVDIYELDYGEVAHILNVPVGTIKSRLARARLQMRQKLLNDIEYFQPVNLPMAVSQSCLTNPA